MMSYYADKPNFPELLVKLVKITLKVKVNDQPRVSKDAYLEQIWWFQLKSVMSYNADKVKFTNRWTGADNESTLWPERQRGN